MNARATTASGDRSVAVGGDIVGSVIITGDVQIQVGAGGVGGTLLYLLGSRRRVKTRARPMPVDVRPAPFDDRLDRETEVAALATCATSRLSVTGEALVGKTYVVRAALAEPAASAPRNGIVCISGRGRSLEDLLQALWEALYESRPPAKPSHQKLREDLAERELLLVVDDAELDHGDAQVLADTLPRSRLVLVSRERRLWDGTELPIAGLSPDAGLALLARDIARPLTADERQAAAAVYVAVGGHPQRLRQAAGIVARGAQTLEQLAASLSGGADLTRAAIATVNARERDVLAALEPFGDGPVAAAQVEELAGPAGAKAADALVRLGIAVSPGPSYSLAVDLGDALDADRLEAARSRAVDHIARLAENRLEAARSRALDHAARPAERHPETLGDDLPGALSLMRRSAALGRWQDVRRLGLALAPACVLARRFGAWGETANLVYEAARKLDDLAATAWALHEKGTRALCRDDPAGRAILREALDLRERIGDEKGAAATRHNLTLTIAPAWYLRRIAHVPVIAVVIALALLVGGVGAAVISGGEDDPGSSTLTEPLQRTLHITISGEGAVAVGSAEPCTKDCDREFDDGRQIRLSATPAAGSKFAGWSGDCSGTDCDCSGTDCTVSLEEDRSVTATFAVIPPPGSHTLTVAVAEGGTITSEPEGIKCPGECTASFREASSVTLSATPDDDWRLKTWGRSGCDQPTGDCTVDLSSDATVQPIFTRLVKLEIAAANGGSVSFTDTSGTTLACPKDCKAAYPAGTSVTLHAAPSEGHTDPGWQRTGCPNGPDCTVDLVADTTVTPKFPPTGSHTLTVAVAEGGTITSEPEGIKCPGECTASFREASSVTLSATPDDDWRLKTWGRSGCDQPTGDCTVDLSSDATVQPIFTRLVKLEIAAANGGSVSFTDTSGTTLACPKDCKAAYPAGTSVTLHAAPSEGHTDPGWQRTGCPNGPDCTVDLVADTTVTPKFPSTASLKLTLRGNGAGTVHSDDPPFDCQEQSCPEDVLAGHTVRLEAIPATGSEFLSWRGDAGRCRSSLKCSIVIDNSPAVTAIFMQMPRLTVTVKGSMESRVVSKPEGIDCRLVILETTCTASFPSGTTVTLTAEPPPKSGLEAWSGDICSGNKSSCDVPMTGSSSDYHVTAFFNKIEP